MANLLSLIVRIGAQDQEIQKALASVGEKARSVDADLKKLGNSPLASSAQKSLDTLTATMKTVTDAQQRLADRATLAAHGLEAMGGASRLTDSQLKQVNRTLQDGLSAYSALGKEPPAALRRIAEETKNATGATEKWITAGRQLGAALGFAFSGTALLNLGRELLRMGDEIQRVSDRTGLFTDEVQKLSFISKQSGNSIDELTGAVGQMQNRLSSGDKSAVGAVRELGLSFQQLKAAGPYQQLQLIAEAVAKIPDPADRARVAMDLFGRTGIAILPTLVSEFKRLGDEAPVMSDATVKALDKAGDAIAKFSLTIKVTLAESYNYAGKLFDGLTAFGMRFRAAFAESTASLLEMAAKIPGATKVVPQLGDAIAGLRAHAVQSRDAAMLLTTSIEDGTDKTRKAIPVVADYDAIVGKAGGSLSKAATEQDRWNEKVAAVSGTMRGFAHDLELVHFQMGQIAVLESRVFGSQARSPLGILPTSASRRIGSGLGTEPTIALPTIDVAGMFSGVKDAFQGILADINDVFIRAFEGGGNVIGAVKALATKVVSALASAIPVVGPAIAQFAGAIVAGFSKIFGGFFGTAGRDAVRDFAAGFVGGFDGLHQQLATLGEEGEALWKSLTQGVGRNSPEQAKAAIDAVTKALEANKRRFEELQTAVGDVSTKLRGLTTITPTIRAAMDKLFDQKNTAGYLAAVKDLNTELDKQAKKYDDIKSAMDKYGIGFKDAGDEFQQSAINNAAQDLRKDFDLLRGSGIDVNAVMRGMGKSIRDFIADAKAAGVEVPRSMQEVIQVAIDSGEVFDENGDKVTDITQLGLTFGDTMETVMADVETAVDRLTIVLEGLAKFLGIELPEAARDGAAGVEDAFNKAKPKVTVEIDTRGLPKDVNGRIIIGNPGGYGGGGTELGGVDQGYPGFARGGIVPGPLGAPVQALVHGGELVLNQQQQRSMGGSMQVVVNFNGPVLAEADYIEKHVTPNVIEGIERNFLRRFGRTVQMAGAT